jgi:hypothetical protein
VVSKSRERRERSLRSELEGESMDGLVEGGASVFEGILVQSEGRWRSLATSHQWRE